MDTAENRLKMLQSSGQVRSIKRTYETPRFLSGAKLRFMLAVAFFLVFCVLEQKGLTFMGLSGEKIYESVCENAKGFDFVLDFPYTLDN